MIQLRQKPVLLMRLPGVAWGLFFLVIVASWWLLLVLGNEHQAATPFDNGWLGALDPDFSAELWRSLCLSAAADFSLPALFGMWGLMALAMMAPAAVPVLKAYQDILAGGGKRAPTGAFWCMLAGYLSVWAGYGMAAALLQYQLSALALVNGHGVLLSDWATVFLLLVAGGYQFTALKAACLSKCRAPMAFFMSHWLAGRLGAYGMGLRHGTVCVGCCWALMLLGFAGGTMNAAWMAGAMVLMILEKLPQAGRHVTGPLGFVLLVAALVMSGRASGLMEGF